MSEKKPFEIARETLKQLTTRQLLPTPLNYQATYNEIAGIAQVQPLPVDTPSEIESIPVPAPTAELLAQIGSLIKSAQPALGTDDENFAEQTRDLLAVLQKPETDMTTAQSMMTVYCRKLSLAAQDQAEIKASLLNLLHLVFKNIGELSIDEQWLKGQMDALMEASTPPLNLRRLDNVERRLKEVVSKQTDAKQRALGARQASCRLIYAANG